MPQRVGETFAPDLAGGGENAAAVEAGVVGDNPAPDYSAVLERDLFGSRVSTLRGGQSVPVDDASSVLPSEDELEIALLGTVAGSPAISRAIIKDLETNVLGQYKTGETVLTASIESIEKDRIVVLHRCRRKVLYLHNPQFEGGNSDNAQATLQANAPQPAGASPSPRPVATFADRLRHTAMLLPKATVEPYSVAGEVEGLRVTDLENIGGAQDLGLRDGDVIRAINGHRLNSKQKAFQIAMKARSQATLSVELMRDNRVRTFSLPLR
jgi:type II secretion system protein C